MRHITKNNFFFFLHFHLMKRYSWGPRKKDEFFNQRFLANGSGFINKNIFLKENLFFSPKYTRYDKMLGSKMVYFREIYKSHDVHFFIEVISFLYQ